MTDVARDFVLYMVMWTMLYLVFRRIVFRRLSATFANVCVSGVHAVVALRIGSMAVDWKHPLSNYGTATTPQQLNLLTVSLAYFTYDSICCELIEHDLPNFLHHVATILGLAVGSVLTLFACADMLQGIIDVFWSAFALQELGQKDSALAFANDLVFGLTFMFCRLVVGPFVAYTCLTTPSTSTIVKVGAAGIQVVSVFWAYQIVSVVRHKAKKRKAAAAQPALKAE